MSVKSKIVIITGGNSGLGYQCAKNVAKVGRDYHVVLACRNPARAAEAVKTLKEETGNSHISFMELNLASLKSIRNFCETFNRSGESLYGLVCNAAGNSNDQKSTTDDGFDVTFGVNHLGHFLLTNLLLPHMRDGSRIVFVSSDMHNPPKMFGSVAYSSAKELAFPEKDTGMLRYSMSKLCNIYCTYEMAERLESKGIDITVNAFNPGMMSDTGFARNANILMSFVGKVIAPMFARFQGRLGSSQKSGQQLADLIIDEKWAHTTGRYIDRGKDTESSELSHNKVNALELWNSSMELVGLQADEMII